jgi:hypothetical protein
MKIPTAEQLNQIYDSAAMSLDDVLAVVEAVQGCSIKASDSLSFAMGLIVALKFYEAEKAKAGL